MSAGCPCKFLWEVGLPERPHLQGSWGMDALVVVALPPPSGRTPSIHSQTAASDATPTLLFAAAMLLLFVTLGKFLKAAKQRTGDAAEALLAPGLSRPHWATFCRIAGRRGQASRLDATEDASSLDGSSEHFLCCGRRRCGRPRSW